MKNVIYAVVIGVSIVGAGVVFMARRGGGSGIEKIPDTQMIWVKCAKCNQSYEMGEKQYYKESQEKAAASATPMMITPLLTCQKCAKDGIMRAYKCEKCGEVFRAGSVPADFEDRCPKCKHSATEASRKARLGQQ
jgi:phage FluMu protein Com